MQDIGRRRRRGSDAAIVNAEISGGQTTFIAGDKISANTLVKATGFKLESTLIATLADRKDKPVTQSIPSIETGKEQPFALEMDSAGLKAGFHQATVKFASEPDAWLANNQRFVTFRILEKPRVLVLTEDRNPKHLLQGALKYANYDADHATLADAPDFRKYDAVFVTGIASPTEKLWLDLAAFVRDGHGVCIIPPGEEMEKKAYNSEAAQKVMPASDRA